LHTNYNQLFFANNDKNGAQNEFILPLRLTVFIHNLWWNNFLDSCSVGGSMDASALVSMVVGVSERQQLLLISSVKTQQILVLIYMGWPIKIKT
jgi:hypothetical protein